MTEELKTINKTLLDNMNNEIAETSKHIEQKLYDEIKDLEAENKRLKEALQQIATDNPVYYCWSLKKVIEDNCKDCEENKNGCCMNPSNIAKQALQEQKG